VSELRRFTQIVPGTWVKRRIAAPPCAERSADVLGFLRHCARGTDLDRCTGVVPAPRPPRVLVAEDQPLLRWAIGRMLEPLGAEIVFASTYHAACDLLSAGEFAAVVVASPLEGHSVLGLLRELDRLRPETHLVALCEGEACARLQHEIPRLSLFQKPFTVSALAVVVAPALGEHAIA
jgi:CheY-like chemotaxis protein